MDPLIFFGKKSNKNIMPVKKFRIISSLLLMFPELLQMKNRYPLLITIKLLW